jgi:hypothetical protein
MAQQFQSQAKVRYLAGLWEDTLVYDMQWSTLVSCHCYGEIPGRPGGWRASTWSWASVLTFVEYHNTYGVIEEDFHNTVIDFQCVNASLNPYGELISGLNVVTGRLKSTSVLTTWLNSSVRPFIYSPFPSLYSHIIELGNPFPYHAQCSANPSFSHIQSCF